MIQRKKTEMVKIGNMEIGGKAPISVQSMANTDTRDADSTIKQIKQLEQAGCELVRIAIPDMDSCESIHAIRKNINIPLVADIHFDYQLAIKSMENGVDGIRINPGNIKIKENIRKIIQVAKQKGIAIRFGVNSGSLDQNIVKNHGKPNVKAIMETTENIIKVIREEGFSQAIFSLKSTSVIDTIQANIQFSKEYNYPLHIGITESGFSSQGIVKSSVGLGILLYSGIGDTIRVSLTEDPVNEVKIGYHVLQSLGIRKKGVNLISCPTCGRCKVDLNKIVIEINERLENNSKTLNIAVMGCIVNGPGEAREADLGVAFNKYIGVLFKKGKVIGKYNRGLVIDKLIEEIDSFKS